MSVPEALTVPAGENVAQVVQCPAGKVVLGGGCVISSTPHLKLVQTFPVSDTEWGCLWVNDSGGSISPVVATANAVCATPAP
jgi:hypothetical protein